MDSQRVKKLDEIIFVTSMIKNWKEDMECSICMHKINRVQFAYTNCNHYFHYKCLTKWLNNNMSCPNCRKKLCNCGYCKDSGG